MSPIVKNGLNDRVSAASAKIDATIDGLVENAGTVEEVQALEQYRNELHQLLAERAMAEAITGRKVGR